MSNQIDPISHNARSFGHINLPAYVKITAEGGRLNINAIIADVPLYMMFLDKCINEDDQERRIGLGVRGFARAISMMGANYQDVAEGLAGVLFSVLHQVGGEVSRSSAKAYNMDREYRNLSWITIDRSLDPDEDLPEELVDKVYEAARKAVGV